MSRYKLTVAYDGTNYHGWQIQNRAVTVEEILNRVLSQVLKQPIEVLGASRTDAGVHALGNVAVFDADTPIPGEKLCLALNPFLPPDIRIVNSRQVPDDFHPRYAVSHKTYEYHIINGQTLLPTLRLYAAFVPRILDVEAMKEGGNHLVGLHDFQSFCAAGAQVKTTVRRIVSLEVEEKDIFTDGRQRCREILIRVTGEGFLYNMVRIIAGTLIKVGLHAYPPDHVREILLARDRRKAGDTAPACGLFLKEIRYQPETVQSGAARPSR